MNEVKLNMKFRGVCPHCSECRGLVMIDVFSGYYACSEGCVWYDDFLKDIAHRRHLLWEARRRRDELHAAHRRAAAEARRKAEAEELNSLMAQVPWEEPEWHRHEFPRQYGAGWKIQTKHVTFRDKQIYLTKHVKNDKVIIVRNGVWPVEWLEAGQPVAAEPGHIW